MAIPTNMPDIKYFICSEQRLEKTLKLFLINLFVRILLYLNTYRYERGARYILVHVMYFITTNTHTIHYSLHVIECAHSNIQLLAGCHSDDDDDSARTTMPRSFGGSSLVLENVCSIQYSTRIGLPFTFTSLYDSARRLPEISACLSQCVYTSLGCVYHIIR